MDFRPIFHGISEYEEKQMSKLSGFRDIGTRSPFLLINLKIFKKIKMFLIAILWMWKVKKCLLFLKFYSLKPKSLIYTYKTEIPSVRLSVCLSVCLSVRS